MNINNIIHDECGIKEILEILQQLIRSSHLFIGEIDLKFFTIVKIIGTFD